MARFHLYLCILKSGENLVIENNPGSDQITFEINLVSTSLANEEFSEFQEIRGIWKHKQVHSKVEADLNQRTYEEILMTMADSTEIDFVIWAILNELGISEIYQRHPDWLEKHMSRIFNLESPYLLSLKSEYNYLKINNASPKNKIPVGIKFAIFLLLPGAFILIWFNRKKGQNQDNEAIERKLSSLSIQEFKIYELLKEGQSNKEIAQIMNIEISTVKSHINSIYSKLGVKSRKEIFYLQHSAK